MPLHIQNTSSTHSTEVQAWLQAILNVVLKVENSNTSTCDQAHFVLSRTSFLIQLSYNNIKMYLSFHIRFCLENLKARDHIEGQRWKDIKVISRAMAQVVSHRPLTAEAQVCAWVSLCGICGEQACTGPGFFFSSTVFSCQYHSTMALHTHIT
jgi:hypothetical protein